MNLILFLFVIVPPTAVLTAWVAWLIFNYQVAKRLGVNGLRATPDLSKAFNLCGWALLIPAKLLRAVIDILTRGSAP